jgi:hypothetical protein
MFIISLSTKRKKTKTLSQKAQFLILNWKKCSRRVRKEKHEVQNANAMQIYIVHICVVFLFHIYSSHSPCIIIIPGFKMHDSETPTIFERALKNQASEDLCHDPSLSFLTYNASSELPLKP